VRILFDHCTPQKLRRFFGGHIVVTARELGWDRLQNGLLIEAGENGGFDLLISADQSIRYQQNLTKRRIALLVLKDARWTRVQFHAERIAAVALAMQPGEYREYHIT
jgi:hypothetical protein